MDTNNDQSEALRYGHDVVVSVLGVTVPLTLGVERAARLVGIGRSSMYAAVKRGDIPTTCINGRIVVLTVPLMERMGLDIESTAYALSEQS